MEGGQGRVSREGSSGRTKRKFIAQSKSRQPPHAPSHNFCESVKAQRSVKRTNGFTTGDWKKRRAGATI